VKYLAQSGFSASLSQAMFAISMAGYVNGFPERVSRKTSSEI